MLLNKDDMVISLCCTAYAKCIEARDGYYIFRYCDSNGDLYNLPDFFLDQFELDNSAWIKIPKDDGKMIQYEGTDSKAIFILNEENKLLRKQDLTKDILCDTRYYPDGTTNTKDYMIISKKR